MLLLIKMFLVILPTVSSQHAKDDKPCAMRNFKRISEGNQALRPSNLISNHTIHLLGECHILCINQDNCYGYNYRVRPSNLYTANCQLSNSTVKMNKTKMKNGPWIFYEDVLVTEDVDECEKRSHQCNQNANCSNTPGSYSCQCQIGYKGNGKQCNDINECADSPCAHNANCTNTAGSYTCECRTGYERNGKNCTDVDECGKGTPEMCDKNANCTNTPGSFNCQCQSGYTGNGSKCKDFDECKKRTHNCSQNEVCRNTQGSYNCQRLLSASEILKNEPGDFQRKLNEWLPQSDKDWNVCWRASRDGWGASTFHSRCDGKSPTLTIVKVVKDNKNYIFGGYATVSWTDPFPANYWTSAPGSFLFSLRNNDDIRPFKSLLTNRNDGGDIYRRNEYGPTFGGGHDLYISNNAGTTAYSYTDLGYSFKTPPGYTYKQANTRSLLAGSRSFTPSEVEVLY